MSDLLTMPINPAFALILGGVLMAFIPDWRTRKFIALAGPVLALWLWLQVGMFGSYGGIHIAAIGLNLEPFRFDGLSRIWALIFIIAAFLNAIYALHERDQVQDAMAGIYGGAAMGAVFAGDLLTLFVFWELTAITSVFLIWRAGTEASRLAGMRYLVMHVGSGVLLLAGAVLLHSQTGSWAFEHIGLETGLAGWLLLLGFGIKAAFPLLHSWLQDSYPKASITGAVVLSSFTTKMAIYALARGFAGEDILIYVGMVMTAFPVFFAVIENDLRRVLSFSINNQLGFMVVGIGIGTTLGINGAAAHAFADVIFKGLLFMSMGAVMFRTGTTKATELGGLFRSMPFSAVFCLIGAGSISAFPFLSAFVTKSLILAAVADEGHWFVFGVLIFASAGVLEHAGIKIPYFAFFAHDSGKRPKEAPWNMLLAMGLASFLCIFLGINYGWLYALLPYPIAYEPYTFGHIVGQMQLLLAAIFAFALLVRIGWYPPEIRMTILDVDWFWRKWVKSFLLWANAIVDRLLGVVEAAIGRKINGIGRALATMLSPHGAFARVVPSGVLAGWTAAFLTLALLTAYLAN
ncbi:Na(+) H(+) antiporter subunit A [hydrothermal vent metagenome]|uniref:Na(+) H(+) antiporter subunit A n=1 Tax=hydrothermal vent metagenome TaxID=652676 RepID=A0A3B0R876_9ZZZZ